MGAPSSIGIGLGTKVERKVLESSAQALQQQREREAQQLQEPYLKQLYAEQDKAQQQFEADLAAQKEAEHTKFMEKWQVASTEQRTQLEQQFQQEIAAKEAAARLQYQAELEQQTAAQRPLLEKALRAKIVGYRRQYALTTGQQLMPRQLVGMTEAERAGYEKILTTWKEQQLQRIEPELLGWKAMQAAGFQKQLTEADPEAAFAEQWATAEKQARKQFTTELGDWYRQQRGSIEKGVQEFKRTWQPMSIAEKIATTDIGLGDVGKHITGFVGGFWGVPESLGRTISSYVGLPTIRAAPTVTGGALSSLLSGVSVKQEGQWDVGGVIGGKKTTVAVGTPEWSPEAQRVGQLGGGYIVGSILGEIVAAYAISGAIGYAGKGIKGISSYAGKSIEAALQESDLGEKILGVGRKVSEVPSAVGRQFKPLAWKMEDIGRGVSEIFKPITSRVPSFAGSSIDEWLYSHSSWYRRTTGKLAEGIVGAGEPIPYGLEPSAMDIEQGLLGTKGMAEKYIRGVLPVEETVAKRVPSYAIAAWTTAAQKDILRKQAGIESATKEGLPKSMLADTESFELQPLGFKGGKEAIAKPYEASRGVGGFTKAPYRMGKEGELFFETSEWAKATDVSKAIGLPEDFSDFGKFGVLPTEKLPPPLPPLEKAVEIVEETPKAVKAWERSLELQANRLRMATGISVIDPLAFYEPSAVGEAVTKGTETTARGAEAWRGVVERQSNLLEAVTGGKLVSGKLTGVGKVGKPQPDLQKALGLGGFEGTTTREGLVLLQKPMLKEITKAVTTPMFATAEARLGRWVVRAAKAKQVPTIMQAITSTVAEAAVKQVQKMKPELSFKVDLVGAVAPAIAMKPKQREKAALREALSPLLSPAVSPILQPAQAQKPKVAQAAKLKAAQMQKAALAQQLQLFSRYAFATPTPAILLPPTTPKQRPSKQAPTTRKKVKARKIRYAGTPLTYPVATTSEAWKYVLGKTNRKGKKNRQSKRKRR